MGNTSRWDSSGSQFGIVSTGTWTHSQWVNEIFLFWIQRLNLVHCAREYRIRGFRVLMLIEFNIFCYLLVHVKQSMATFKLLIVIVSVLRSKITSAIGIDELNSSSNVVFSTLDSLRTFHKLRTSKYQKLVHTGVYKTFRLFVLRFIRIML